MQLDEQMFEIHVGFEDIWTYCGNLAHSYDQLGRQLKSTWKCDLELLQIDEIMNAAAEFWSKL